MSGFTEEWLAQRNRDVLGIGVTPIAQPAAELPQDLRPEWMFEAEATRLLEEDGWRSLRTDPVSDRGRGKGFGEIGMADHLYIRYQNNGYRLPAREPQPHDTRVNALHISSWVSVLWVEFKSAKGKPSKAQVEWHQKERARGALTLIAGVDFPASLAGFTEWYASSALRRRA